MLFRSVKMKGWKRKMDYVQTGLQWIPSSPHIPHPHSAFFYPVSGILGELGYMSIGVGYTIPFQMFAAPWVEAEKLADNLNRLHLPGVIFRPMHLKPFYSVGKEEHLQGVQVHIVDFNSASQIFLYCCLFSSKRPRICPSIRLKEDSLMRSSFLLMFLISTSR